MKKSYLLGLFSLAALGSAAQAQEPKTVFTVLSSTWGAQNFNPFLVPGQRLEASSSAIYESLFFVNTLDGKVNPVLGTKYAWSKDNKTLTITTRSGVKWHDGEAFNAQDVVFTFNFIRANPTQDLNGLWKGGLSAVKASGPNTVVFSFSRPNTALFNFIAHTPIVAEHQWKDVPAPFILTKPIGTGPFTFDAYTPSAIRVLKNPNYWLSGKPAVDALVWRASNSNDASLLMLLKGDADYSFIGLADPQKMFVDRGPNYQYWWPVIGVNVLSLNTTKAPFNDPAFRRAIAGAINTKDVAQKAYVNAAPAADPSAIIPSQRSWIPASAASLAVKYDPAAADKALSAAGYKKNAQGARLGKDGKPLPTFKILVGAGFTDFISIAQVVSQNLGRVGINTTIDQQAPGPWYGSLATGTFDLAPTPLSFVPGPTPFNGFNAAFAPENTAPVGKMATSNFSRYTNPTISAALAQFRFSSDLATQKKAVGTIVTTFMKDMPVIPLTARTQYAMFNTTRFTGFPSAQNPYNDASASWDVGARQMFLEIKPK